MSATRSTTVSIDDMQAIVGDDHAREAESSDAVDGVVPRLVVAPGSVAEAKEIMSFAGHRGLAVAPRGAGTKMDWGNAPGPLDIVLDTSRLNRVLAHEAGDLVVIAEAGVTLDALQETVGRAGQMLGIDSVHRGATLGGVVATNSAGPRRLRYGAARDLLIGITVILPDGTVARSGGKVVKNVAGYDLGKLFTGSFGTLGLIVETIFRLHAVPRARSLVVIDLNDTSAVGACIQSLLHSALVPSAIELHWESGAGQMIVLFEGVETGIVAQAEGTVELGGRFGAAHIPTDEETASLLRTLARLPWSDDEVGLKVVTLPAEVPAALAAIDDVAGAAGVKARVSGQGATTVLWVSLSGDSDAVSRAIGELRARAHGFGGTLTVIHAPVAIKRSVGVWGDVGDALPVMRRIKEQFDPGAIMNPGRFVGGM